MNGPLDGITVVVTRARAQAASLIEALESVGAATVAVPVIEIVDPPDGGAALAAGLAELGTGDWLVMTSPNGATRVGALLADHPLAPGVKVAVVGPGTRARAEAVGIAVDLVPDTSIAEGLLDFLPHAGAGGGTMLLARAETAREVLPEELRARGWRVLDLPAYRTVGVDVAADRVDACRNADVVAFTSSSTVSHLVAGVGVDNLPSVLASIGPATSATIRDLGLAVGVEAADHTIPGLVDAIAAAIDGLVLLRVEPAGDPENQALLEAYYREIDQRFASGLDRDAVQSTHVEEITPPNGCFVAARLAGDPVGCGVVKVTAPGVADLKRMWVSPRVRGRGVGRRLLRRLVAEARAMGMHQVRLETNRALTEAIALYRAEGFVEVPAFNDEPHADHWFTRDL